MKWFSWLRRNVTAAVGLVIILLMLGLAVIGPFLIPHGPTDFQTKDRLQAPSVKHPMGTDQFGRDLLSRVAHGGRVSAVIGVLGTTLALVVGTVIGSVAAYRGGWLDELVMRGVDLMLAFPYLVLAVAFLALVGPGISNLVIVISLSRVPGFARLIRSEVLSLKEREFVEAARATGRSDVGIVFRHILPNAMAPLLVVATLSLATAINAEAALSFLGLGIRPPIPSWGILIAEGRDYLLDAPWIAVYPGIMIGLTSLGCNLLGDGLRDWFDVRTRD